MIQIDGSSGDDWTKGIDEDFNAMRSKTEAAVLAAGLYYEGRVKEKLTGARTGRVYGDHQASAPGEPPATHHGDFRKSITTVVVWRGDEVSAEVGTAAAQARILEYGGFTGRGGATRILPRPLWESTFLEEVDAIGGILEGAAT
jgi:phage gpG-like protein